MAMTTPTESGVKKVRGKPFVKGDARRQNGRPKGSRNQLGEAFVADLHAAWERDGAQVLEHVMKADPSTFLRVIAKVIPSEVKMDVTGSAFEKLFEIVLKGGKI